MIALEVEQRVIKAMGIAYRELADLDDRIAEGAEVARINTNGVQSARTSMWHAIESLGVAQEVLR